MTFATSTPANICLTPARHACCGRPRSCCGRPRSSSIVAARPEGHAPRRPHAWPIPKLARGVGGGRGSWLDADFDALAVSTCRLPEPARRRPWRPLGAWPPGCPPKVWLLPLAGLLGSGPPSSSPAQAPSPTSARPGWGGGRRGGGGRGGGEAPEQPAPLAPRIRAPSPTRRWQVPGWEGPIRRSAAGRGDCSDVPQCRAASAAVPSRPRTPRGAGSQATIRRTLKEPSCEPAPSRTRVFASFPSRGPSGTSTCRSSAGTGSAVLPAGKRVKVKRCAASLARPPGGGREMRNATSGCGSSSPSATSASASSPHATTPSGFTTAGSEQNGLEESQAGVNRQHRAASGVASLSMQPSCSSLSPVGGASWGS
mmetsp:Transcript_24553/g.73270  ORF Transcript_24553/g.73270 Transcript_24553/m.73270 type:complete len:369 (-) Transcript_24553:183-1289(-)